MYSYPSIAIVQSFSPTAALHPRYRHPAASFHVRDGGTSPLPPPDPYHHIRPSQRRSALLRFKSTLSGSSASLPTWIPNATPCLINHTKWEGVICFNGRSWGLHLEDMGFTGRLELSPLVNLHGLCTLNFLGNDLEGPMPDLSRLGALKAVYFSNNSFPGKIHDMTLRSPECAHLKSWLFLKT